MRAFNRRRWETQPYRPSLPHSIRAAPPPSSSGRPAAAPGAPPPSRCPAAGRRTRLGTGSWNGIAVPHPTFEWCRSAQGRGLEFRTCRRAACNRSIVAGFRRDARGDRQPAEPQRRRPARGSNRSTRWRRAGALGRWRLSSRPSCHTLCGPAMRVVERLGPRPAPRPRAKRRRPAAIRTESIGLESLQVRPDQ